MNRRNFLATVMASVGAFFGVTRADAKPAALRFVEFSAPSLEPAVHWTNGHIPVERFVWLFQMSGIEIPPEQVRHGWGTFKLKRIGMYVSDAPQENLEPLTYWIPADHDATRQEA